MTGGASHRFGILGPLEVVIDGEHREPSAPRQRALLALLLLAAGEPVSTDRILDRLWGDAIPDGGTKAVGFHLSKLRDALEPERERGTEGTLIRTTPAGYVLDIAPESIDLVHFEDLADEAGALLPADPGRAALLARDAVGLWRGPILAEFAYDEFAQETIRRIDERRLRVLEIRIEADLALGRHGDVIAELEGLAAEFPLREGLRSSLMIALYRSGRQADALRTYEEGRRVLAEELGIDPSRHLQALEQQILEQDETLDLPVWAAPPKPDPPIAGIDADLVLPPVSSLDPEEVFKALDADERAAAREVFLRLAVPGLGGPDPARKVPISELHGLDLAAASLETVLAEFGAAHLIDFDRDEISSLPTIALAGESAAWGRLNAWLVDASEDLQILHRLTALSTEWDHNARSREYLVGGDRLAEFAEFVTATSLRLTTSERAFLDAALRQKRRSSITNRGRDLIIGAALLPHVLPDSDTTPPEAAVAEDALRTAAESDQTADPDDEPAADGFGALDDPGDPYEPEGASFPDVDIGEIGDDPAIEADDLPGF